MAEVPVSELLEAGVHFGHQTRRWNPKMKKFIFTERNNIYIIDLHKTQKLLQTACDAVRETAAKGDAILFVGTKPQSSGIIKEEAIRCNQFYVNNRWLGGMLTNYRTIRQSIKRLEHFEKMASDGTFEHLTKKEILTIEKQRNRLASVLDGIRNMNRIPGLVVVVDTKKEKLAVNEANRLGIPVCAILDTNCDPDPITYPIPGNDDAIRSIKLLISNVTDAIIEGIQSRVDDEVVAEKESGEAEATAERKPRRRRSRSDRGGSSRPHERAGASTSAADKTETAKKAGTAQEAKTAEQEKPRRRRPESGEKEAAKSEVKETKTTVSAPKKDEGGEKPKAPAEPKTDSAAGTATETG